MPPTTEEEDSSEEEDSHSENDQDHEEAGLGGDEEEESQPENDQDHQAAGVGGGEVSHQDAVASCMETSAEAERDAQPDRAEVQVQQGTCAAGELGSCLSQQDNGLAQNLNQQQTLAGVPQSDAAAECGASTSTSGKGHSQQAFSPLKPWSGLDHPQQGHSVEVCWPPGAIFSGSAVIVRQPSVDNKHTPNDTTLQSTCQQAPGGVPHEHDLLRSADPWPSSLHQASATPTYYHLFHHPASKFDPQASGHAPAQCISLHASDQPRDDPLAVYWRSPTCGLGLDDEIWVTEFLADGKHVFLEGKAMDNPFGLVCWQVLSIPDGRTTALAWKTKTLSPSLWIGGKWIITQSTNSLQTFRMDTFEPCCKIDLQKVLRQVADAELELRPHGMGRTIACSGTSMAVAVCSGPHEWVLVFGIATGSLQAISAAPSGTELSPIEWIAPEPFPVLAVKQCINRSLPQPAGPAEDRQVNQW